MLYTRLFFLIALSDLKVIQGAKRRFDVDLYRFECKNNSAHVKRFLCDMIKLGRNRYRVNIDYMYDQNVGPDVEAHLNIKVSHSKRDKTINFVDFKINVCDGLSKIYKTPLIKDMIDEMRRSSNVPYSCPFKKNVLYKVQNYSVDESIFPAYSPYINFTFTLNFNQNQKLMVGLVMRGALVPRS